MTKTSFLVFFFPVKPKTFLSVYLKVQLAITAGSIFALFVLLFWLKKPLILFYLLFSILYASSLLLIRGENSGLRDLQSKQVSTFAKLRVWISVINALHSAPFVSELQKITRSKDSTRARGMLSCVLFSFLTCFYCGLDFYWSLKLKSLSEQTQM